MLRINYEYTKLIILPNIYAIVILKILNVKLNNLKFIGINFKNYYF